MGQIKINSNLKLFDWQYEVIRGIQENGKGSIHIVKSKRQCGKSVMLESILLKTAIEKNKTVSILLSPTLEQARKIFNEIKAVVKPTPVYARHNDIQLNLVLRNGSRILFRSAEQKNSLRGYTVTGIYCIDEAAFIPDDIFYETLAWVNVSKAPIVVCSTPKFKLGWFYKYYMIGFENNNKVYSYNWSLFDTSALLDSETLDRYRKEVPANQFKTEFLGEFLDNEGGVFGDFDGIVVDDWDENLNCYMGIDWGTGSGNDDTAVCIFNEKKQMIFLDCFNDKDETSTIKHIVSIIKKYKPLKVQVETNSIGSIFFGLLDKAIKAEKLPVMLIGFTTSNSSKEKLVNNFQVAIQNKDTTILPNSKLLTEMAMYELKLSSTGKKTYNAADGYHDDAVIAMLLAFDCISKGVYLIR